MHGQGRCWLAGAQADDAQTYQRLDPGIRLDLDCPGTWHFIRNSLRSGLGHRRGSLSFPGAIPDCDLRGLDVPVFHPELRRIPRWMAFARCCIARSLCLALHDGDSAGACLSREKLHVAPRAALLRPASAGGLHHHPLYRVCANAC